MDIAAIRTTDDLARFIEEGVVTQGEERVTTTTALRTAAVYRCVNLLSAVIGNAHVRVKGEFDYSPDEQHEISRLLNRRPNRIQSPFEFKKMMTQMALLRGNGVAKKVRVGRRTVALQPLRGHLMIEEQRDGSILYKHANSISGRHEELTQDDVLHIRGMSFDGVRGESVISYARQAIGMSQVTARHGMNFFKRGTNVSGYLTHPDRLGPEGIDNLRQSLDEFEGPDGERSGRPMILEEGMEYKPITMTAADAQFVENRKMSIMEICIFFGVPPHMIGFTENQTSYGQGVQEQSRGFRNYGLSDLTGMWQGAIDRDLIPVTENKVSELDLYNLTVGNELERWQANRIKLEMGVHNPDEIRRRHGEPAIPGGRGARYYDPPNVPQQAGTETTQETPANDRT